jgi:hypothetical protein
MSELTERRKADRAVMVKQVAALAEGHGITAEVRSGGRGPLSDASRAVSVNLAGPHTLGLTVIFDGNSPQSEPDTYVLSWHMRPRADEGKGRQLAPHAFGSVNSYHGHKATDVARGFAQLYYLLSRRFAAIADGSAFVAGPAK